MRFLLLLLALLGCNALNNLICKCQEPGYALCTTNAQCSSTAVECLCEPTTEPNLPQPAVHADPAAVDPNTVELETEVSYTTAQTALILIGIFAAAIGIIVFGVYFEKFSISWRPRAS